MADIEKPVTHEYTSSPTYVKLTSSDGKTHYVNKDVLVISKHLDKCISSKLVLFLTKSGAFKERKLDEGINLDLPSDILEICIKFMHYKYVNRKVSFERPPFPIEPELGKEVLKAAIYLQV